MKFDRKKVPEPESLTVWLDRLQEGDNEAIEEIYNRYSKKMAECAAKRIRGETSLHVDQDDIVNSVFRMIVRKSKEGRFPRLNHSTDLLPFLLSVVAHKTIDYIRKEKRKFLGLSFSEVLERDSLDPHLSAASTEFIQKLFDSLKKERLQEIVKLKVDGMLNKDIATKLGISPKTVTRKLSVIKRIWMDQISLQQ